MAVDDQRNHLVWEFVDSCVVLSGHLLIFHVISVGDDELMTIFNYSTIMMNDE